MNDDAPMDGSADPQPEVSGAGTEMWVPPTTEDLQQLLPQFEVLELIGYGGMGAVYKARQLSLDRLVAIKILPLHALDVGNTDHVERFRNEARLMARMNHPDIVTVYDFGETSDGHLYFIMEFVDGTDVEKMIEGQGRLPPEYALAITAHVCDALQYAHTHGVIHRDIKPGNVLINMEGEVKVADFGIANAGSAHVVGLTEGNVTLGTPDYIAPEALTIGVEVDRRADLYSIGVMLYNMLTGALPQGEYLPASHLAGSDVRYDAIIARALQYDRELRYQSAREIRHDLDDIIATPVVKEGDVTGRAAIPKQFVHRRAANAPVFRRPVASDYKIVPVRKDHTNTLWFIFIVIVLGAGVYWRNDLQSMLESSGKSVRPIAKPREATTAGGKSSSSIDVSEAFSPRDSSSSGKQSPSASPQQSSSESPVASGTWITVQGAEGGSVQLESNSARFGSECNDGAIRARINNHSNDRAYLLLRCGKDGSRYGFILKPTGKAEIAYWASRGGKGEALKDVEYDKTIRQTEYTVEFRAAGSKLTALLNGEEILSVDDDNLSRGCFGIDAKDKEVYREVAILNSDSPNSSQDTSAAPASPVTDPRLTQIETQFHEAYERDIVPAHEAAVSDLDSKYVAALDRADAAATKAGKSDESLRLKEEKSRVQNKQPMPSTEVEPVPASLKQLRVTYAAALAKIDHDSDLKSRFSYDELDKQLDGLQKSLVEEQRTEEAQLVKARRDQIADKMSRHEN